MSVLKVILTLWILLANIIFLALKDHLSPAFLVLAVFFCLLGRAVHLLFHEGGHWLGGILSGYRLARLQLGPLNILRDKSGKLSVSWKNSFSGQCVMIPGKAEKVPFRAYNLGGVFANFLLTLFSPLLLLTDSFSLSLLAVELFCVGIEKALVNLIPHKSDGTPNDGYVVKLLKRDEATRKDYGVYLRLYGALLWKEPIAAGDYRYEREAGADPDALLYYQEIQSILDSLEPEADCGADPAGTQ